MIKIKNTKDHQILTDILREEENDYVSWYAAQNPNCTPEILTEILRRGNDDGVSCSAAENPNCPKEMLVEVLRRGKNCYGDSYASGIAATLGHIRAMKKISLESDSFAIIVEDDVRFHVDFNRYLEMCETYMNKRRADILSIGFVNYPTISVT